MLKLLRIFFTIQLSIFNLYMTINSVYLCGFYEDKEYDKSMLLDHLNWETDTHSNPSIHNKNLMDESYMEFNKDIMETYIENQDTVSENALREEYNSEPITGESISDLLTDNSIDGSYIEHYDPSIETDRETHIENQDTRYKNVSKEGYNNENDTGKSISELSTDSIKSEILDQIYPESNLRKQDKMENEVRSKIKIMKEKLNLCQVYLSEIKDTKEDLQEKKFREHKSKYEKLKETFNMI
ncbi:hypothetical protein CWI37_0198p0020 [Hamiltosporidium tvaerminnensis]|uniref:Uncharacterized protein n=1 Tax=Hamiltosporidium tvaerminnensis TaxID=1176355 RepID=A0A4Q9L8F6_9MICR|nr:hypothetical protein CWI37_0198p0020 [Hamiltosporidium tvaerminnensis]